MNRDRLPKDSVKNHGWRSISAIERAAAMNWLNEFEPTSDEEKRAKKILKFFVFDNMSASAIARMRDPDIVAFGNRSKGMPLGAVSILRIIYTYFPEWQGRNNKSTEGNKRVEQIRKREKQKSPHIRQCAFCGSQDNLEEHHMIPLFLGGTNDDRNLVFLCKGCHKSVSSYQARIRQGKAG